MLQFLMSCRTDVGFHLNADESVVTGAVYFGVSSRFNLEYPVSIPIEIALVRGKERSGMHHFDEANVQVIYSKFSKQGEFSLVVTFPNEGLDEYFIEIAYKGSENFNQLAQGTK